MYRSHLAWASYNIAGSAEDIDMASASSYAWEKREGWEGRGLEEVDDSDGDSDEEAVFAEGVEAGEQFMEVLLGLHFQNRLSAKQLGILCWYGSRAGLQGPAAQFAHRPNDPATGHFQRKVDTALGIDLRPAEAYFIDMPGHAKADLSRTTHRVRVNPFFDSMEQDVRDEPRSTKSPAELRDDPEWGPRVQDHPVLRNATKDVAVISLYLDGVAYTKRSSMLGIFAINMFTQKRTLVAALRKRDLCKCGCHHWCSLYVVFRFVHWCLASLATGIRPTEKHDGTAWSPNAGHHFEKAGQDLGFVAPLLWIKGDLVEYCTSLGFSGFTTKFFPCLFCKVTDGGLGDCTGMDGDGFPWDLNTQRDIDRSCEACEVVVQVTEAHHRAILPLLRFDKREDGARGRALVSEYAPLGLQANDRLEPNGTLIDIAKFESINEFPATLCFWRRSRETRCRHRNPLWDSTIGVTLDCLVLDALHVLYLGIFGVIMHSVFWDLITENAYGFSGPRTEAEIATMSVLRLRNDIMNWYRSQPAISMTKIEDLTVSMLGTKDHPKLMFKASEVKHLCPFLVWILRQHGGGLRRGATLLALCEVMVAMIQFMDRQPQVLTVVAWQDDG
jgi:hypothetical protein